MRKTNNLARNYRDGQTRMAAIEPVERLHDGIEFRYRPMLGEDAEAAQAKITGQESSKTGYMLICDMVAGQVIEWSESVEIKKDTVRYLPYKIVLGMYRIVLGLQASDPLSDEDADSERVGELGTTPEGEVGN